MPQGIAQKQSAINNGGVDGIRLILQRARDLIVSQIGYPIVTGRLIGSIQGMAAEDSVQGVEMRQNSVLGYFGTRVPYARRVEFGFTGPDSLGRMFKETAKTMKNKGIHTRGFQLGILDRSYLKLLVNSVNGRIKNNAGSY